MKRQRYEEALGEAGEVAVVAEVVVSLGSLANEHRGVARGALEGAGTRG